MAMGTSELAGASIGGFFVVYFLAHYVYWCLFGRSRRRLWDAWEDAHAPLVDEYALSACSPSRASLCLSMVTSLLFVAAILTAPTCDSTQRCGTC
ncbi:hypothetical protein PINS_up015539 [Pythium insidiosum]|nr:hypothetical protein PINS_up015539 [Pythium insidiosum]